MQHVQQLTAHADLAPDGCLLPYSNAVLQQYKWHEPSREAIEGAFDKLLQVRCDVLCANLLQAVILLAGVLCCAWHLAVLFQCIAAGQYLLPWLLSHQAP